MWSPIKLPNRFRFSISLFAFAVFSLEALPSAWSREEWQSGALLLYSKASMEMNRLRAEGLNNKRLLAYIDAMEFMHHELGDSDSIAESRGILRALIEADPRDDVGVASAYYDIRITQLLQPNPDPAKAVEDFKVLYAAHPAHFFGQLALLKATLLELAEIEFAGASTLSELARLEGKQEQLTISDLRRSYHKSMGETYLRGTGLDAKAFEHLKAAYDIGFSIDGIQADLCFDLGRLAERMGNVSYAIRRYQEFIEKYGDDARAAELAAHLSVLKKG